MTSSRSVLQVFEKYQKDRVTFVQTIAELATRPQVGFSYPTRPCRRPTPTHSMPTCAWGPGRSTEEALRVLEWSVWRRTRPLTRCSTSDPGAAAARFG